MHNPYLPEIDDTARVHALAQPCDVEEPIRKISLSHPYKDYDTVTKELAKQLDEDRVQVYNKMAQSLRSNDEAMLKLISKDARAYVYATNNSKDFKIQAIGANPQVYGLLSRRDMNDHALAGAYLKSMNNHMVRQKISPSEYAMTYKYQFSDRCNHDLIFSPESYRHAYEKMVAFGPFSPPSRTISREAQYVAMSRLAAQNNPMMNDVYNKIEQSIWRENMPLVQQCARNDRREGYNDLMLSAVEERCPDFKPMIRLEQQKFWNRQRERLMELQIKNASGQTLEQQEKEYVQEGMRHVSFSEKEKNEMVQRIEKERLESIAYLKNDSIENTYAAHIRGDIEFDEASGLASYIEHIPSKGTHGRAVEALARTEAAENDTHNRDGEYELQMDKYEDFNKTGIEEEEEIERREDRQDWDEQQADQEEERKYEYNPFFSPPDEERTQVWNPN